MQSILFVGFWNVFHAMMEKGMTATKHDTLVVDNAAIIDVKLNFHLMDIVVLPTEALMRRPQGTKLKFQLAHFKTESLSETHSYVKTHTQNVCQGRHVDIQHFRFLNRIIASQIKLRLNWLYIIFKFKINDGTWNSQ